MRHLSLSIIIATLLLAGCGHYENSIYDTSRNPENFPEMACDLLDRFDSGQLATADQITEGFNMLYTEHSELFENDRWREIITLLGPLFAERADSLAAQGPSAFSAAAGFYILTSMAAPEDAEARDRGLMFDAWLRGLDEAGFDAATPDLFGTSAAVVQVVRYFLLGDSLQQHFARNYLVGAAFDSLMARGDGELTAADKAFLIYANLSNIPLDAPQASFAEPKLDLLASRLAPGPDDVMRLELYFRAAETIDGDCQLVLRGAHPIDNEVAIIPDPAMSDWLPGEVVLAVTPIEYVDPKLGLSCALKRLQGKKATFVAVEGTEQAFVTLPAPLSD